MYRTACKLSVPMYLLLSFSSFSQIDAPVDLNVFIMRTGQFHGEEIQAVSGEEWWGLYPSNDGFEVLKTTVRVSDVHDPVIDADAEVSGKLVSVDGDGEPLVLIHGVGNLSEGLVNTAFLGNTFVRLGEYQGLRLGKGKSYHQGQDSWHLAALGRAEEVGRGIGIVEYELMLYKNLWSEDFEKQRIHRVDSIDLDGAPQLLWAGDLDRDGELDLLMDLAYHYNVSVLTLFLSSSSESGFLVKKVAEQTTYGC